MTTLRLHPIDVGFDLRAQGIAVVVPADCAGIEYETWNGGRELFRAPRTALIAKLEEPGFEVAGDTWTIRRPGCTAWKTGVLHSDVEVELAHANRIAPGHVAVPEGAL